MKFFFKHKILFQLFFNFLRRQILLGINKH